MHWRKSTFSATGGSCVELAVEGELVHVRNSNHPERGSVRLPAPVMAAFVAACAAGDLDDLARA